jgi:8-oxo-dGTP pyrophosphatase MutT (NUDIX family)
MGAGILPITLFKGTLYLLLGQERRDHLWSDFGGSSNKGETPFKTALREGTEELNGFLGNEKELSQLVTKSKVLSIKYDQYTSYVFHIPYNKDLPTYFSNVNNFAETHLKDKIDSNHNGLYEKTRIEWFPINKFKTPKTNQNQNPKLRIYYSPFVATLINNEEYVIEEIKKLKRANKQISK